MRIGSAVAGSGGSQPLTNGGREHRGRRKSVAAGYAWPSSHRRRVPTRQGGVGETHRRSSKVGLRGPCVSSGQKPTARGTPRKRSSRGECKIDAGITFTASIAEGAANLPASRAPLHFGGRAGWVVEPSNTRADFARLKTGALSPACGRERLESQKAFERSEGRVPVPV